MSDKTKVEYFAIGPFAWGRSVTADKALANCKVNIPWSYLKKTCKEIPVRVYQITDGLTINIGEMDGSISWDSKQGTAKLFETVKVKRPRGR